MSKIENSFKKKQALSATMQELIEACGYGLKSDTIDALSYINASGDRILRFTTDGFIMSQQLFEAEDDRKEQLVTMFTATINYSMRDEDMSVLLQLIGAIDIKMLPEYMAYQRIVMPGGNAGFFGIRKAVA